VFKFDRVVCTETEVQIVTEVEMTLTFGKCGKSVERHVKYVAGHNLSGCLIGNTGNGLQMTCLSCLVIFYSPLFGAVYGSRT